MGLVDMCVATLIKAVGRFTSIIPILQAQLMSILAMCAAQAGQAPPDNKEDCEAQGGTWIDPDELKDLQNMYDMISTTNLNVDDEYPTTDDGGSSMEYKLFCDENFVDQEFLSL